MLYFDSDVVFNALVKQDEVKHFYSRNLLLNSINELSVSLSALTIQEVGYGMAREGVPAEEIKNRLFSLTQTPLVSVTHQHILRAVSLATKIGFKHINDCIHTAIAESLDCEKLYTYNKSDFKRIQKHTNLNIIIL